MFNVSIESQPYDDDETSIAALVARGWQSSVSGSRVSRSFSEIEQYRSNRSSRYESDSASSRTVEGSSQLQTLTSLWNLIQRADRLRRWKPLFVVAEYQEPVDLNLKSSKSLALPILPLFSVLILLLEDHQISRIRLIQTIFHFSGGSNANKLQTPSRQHQEINNLSDRQECRKLSRIPLLTDPSDGFTLEEATHCLFQLKIGLGALLRMDDELSSLSIQYLKINSLHTNTCKQTNGDASRDEDILISLRDNFGDNISVIEFTAILNSLTAAFNEQVELEKPRLRDIQSRISLGIPCFAPGIPSLSSGEILMGRWRVNSTIPSYSGVIVYPTLGNLRIKTVNQNSRTIGSGYPLTTLPVDDSQVVVICNDLFVNILPTNVASCDTLMQSNYICIDAMRKTKPLPETQFTHVNGCRTFHLCVINEIDTPTRCTKQRFMRESLLLYNLTKQYNRVNGKSSDTSVTDFTVGVYHFGICDRVYAYRVIVLTTGTPLENILRHRRSQWDEFRKTRSSLIAGLDTNLETTSLVQLIPSLGSIGHPELVSGAFTPSAFNERNTVTLILTILKAIRYVSNILKTGIAHTCLTPSTITVCNMNDLTKICIVGWGNSIWDVSDLLIPSPETREKVDDITAIENSLYVPEEHPSQTIVNEMFGNKPEFDRQSDDALSVPCLQEPEHNFRSRDVRYTSPLVNEMRCSHNHMNHIDLFSIGCIGYELLCLLPPFVGQYNLEQSAYSDISKIDVTSPHWSNIYKLHAIRFRERGDVCPHVAGPTLGNIYDISSLANFHDSDLRLRIMKESTNSPVYDIKSGCLSSSELASLIMEMIELGRTRVSRLPVIPMNLLRGTAGFGNTITRHLPQTHITVKVLPTVHYDNTLHNNSHAFDLLVDALTLLNESLVPFIERFCRSFAHISTDENIPGTANHQNTPNILAIAEFHDIHDSKLLLDYVIKFAPLLTNSQIKLTGQAFYNILYDFSTAEDIHHSEDVQEWVSLTRVGDECISEPSRVLSRSEKSEMIAIDNLGLLPNSLRSVARTNNTRNFTDLELQFHDLASSDLAIISQSLMSRAILGEVSYYPLTPKNISCHVNPRTYQECSVPTSINLRGNNLGYVSKVARLLEHSNNVGTRNDGFETTVSSDLELERTNLGVQSNLNTLRCDGGFDAFASSLKFLKGNLTVIDISGNSLSVGGSMSIFQELVHLCLLKKLHIRDCGIGLLTDASAVLFTLSNSLKKLHQLEDLDLSTNYISDIGVSHIAELIEHCPGSYEKTQCYRSSTGDEHRNRNEYNTLTV